MKSQAIKKKIKQRNRRRLFNSLILLAIGVGITLIIAFLQPFYTFNLWFEDQLIQSESPSSNIVIVGIDDASMAEFGKWAEWPRNLHTTAIDNLSASGASVIGYDIIFTDESPDDVRLAAAVGEAGNVILAVAGTERVSSASKELTVRDFLLPVEPLRENSSGLGHVNIVPDPDGKVRRIPVIASDESGNTYPSLAIAILQTHFHQPQIDNYKVHNNKITLAMRDVSVDNSYFMRLNFAVTDNSLTYISYKDVVNNSFEPATVKNKIVLVGIMATGDLDTWSVPTSPVRIPGVLLHAAAIDTILRTSFITEAGMNVTVFVILLLTCICAALFPWTGTWKRSDILKVTGITIGLLLVYVVACVLASNRGYLLSVLYPSITLLALYIGNIIYMIVREQNDKKFIKELFGRYVSPQISKEIVSLADEGELNLGGEEKEVTVMFADIRNFTTLSEKMPPDAVVKMLNSCLPILIDAIVENGGLVNKFAGDSLMGVWNAPNYVAGHQYLAVKAAWEAQQKMDGLYTKNTELNNVHFGIGINTGKAVAGNVGSTGRVEYTVIGDTVNLASRICSVALGKEILIGPDTYNQIQDSIIAEPLSPQVFKGKSQPIIVYRIKGLISLP